MLIEICDLLPQIKKLTGAFEAYYRIASFKCYRYSKGGKVQEVVIDLYDAGPSVSPSLRYSVEVNSDDGRSATGNPDSSIELALDHVHWHELDGDEDDSS